MSESTSLWDGFRKITWEETSEGEILTDDAKYIPMIKEWIQTKPWRKGEEVCRTFCEKYGGTWVTAEDCELLKLFISNE